MEKTKLLLDDYVTFGKLAMRDLDFLDGKFSQEAGVLTKLANYGKSREFGDTLSDDDKVSLALYGYHIFVSEEVELKQSINAFKSYYETFRDKKDLDRFSMYISYLSNKMLLAKSNTHKDDMPIILSRALNRKDNIQKIKLVVPIVPTKSPFTIVIISLLNEVVKRLSIAKIDFEIEIGWNMCVYNKMSRNLSGHFDFDKEDLSFETLKYHIEQNFRSTINSLILNSRWGSRNEKETKMGILRNTLTYGREEDYHLENKDMDSRIVHTSNMKRHIWRLLLADTKEYSPEEPGHVINYLGTLIMNQCAALERGVILFITPLPIALVLDCSLKLIEERAKEEKKEKEIEEIKDVRRKLYLLCYLPFPGSPDIRKRLPFYILPYSYYRHGESNEPTGEKFVLKRDYTHRLLISCLKKLNTAMFDIPTMEEDFTKMVTHMNIFFRNEDDRLNEYLRYI